jgi:hypothetical protein
MADPARNTATEAVSTPGRAEPWFSPGKAGLVAAAGFILMVLYLLASQFLPQMRFGKNGEASSYGNSAVGYAGFMSLLQSLDMPVRQHRQRLYTPIPDNALIVLPLTVRFDESLVKRVSQLKPEQRLLVVMPRWYVFAVEHDGWLKKFNEMSPNMAGLRLTDLLPNKNDPPEDQPDPPDPEAAKNRPSPFLRVKDGVAKDCESQMPGMEPFLANLARDPQELQGFNRAVFDELAVLLGCDELGVLVQGMTKPRPAAESREIYVLSDPGLIANLRLDDRVTLTAMAQMIEYLREGERPVVFDETLAGPPLDPDLWSAAFSPPVLALTVLVLLLFSFWVWRSVPRFGTPVGAPRALQTGKHTLIWNTADLLVAKADFGALARAYRGVLLTALSADASMGLRARANEGTAAASAEWAALRADSRKTGKSWRAFDAGYEAALDEKRSARAPHWLARARQLHKLAKDIHHEPGRDS